MTCIVCVRQDFAYMEFTVSFFFFSRALKCSRNVDDQGDVSESSPS